MQLNKFMQAAACQEREALEKVTSRERVMPIGRVEVSPKDAWFWTVRVLEGRVVKAPQVHHHWICDHFGEQLILSPDQIASVALATGSVFDVVQDPVYPAQLRLAFKNEATARSWIIQTGKTAYYRTHRCDQNWGARFYSGDFDQIACDYTLPPVGDSEEPLRVIKIAPRSLPEARLANRVAVEYDGDVIAFRGSDSAVNEAVECEQVKKVLARQFSLCMVAV